MARITALTFIVPVKDLDAAVSFYNRAFDLEVLFRNESIAFVGLPGTDSALGLLLLPDEAGSGPRHIGFHVDHAVGLDAAINDVEAAGGRVIERGQHGPEVPFAIIADPDGNRLEI
jgi:predicted enzyme related to lactoylglutathione lyase